MEVSKSSSKGQETEVRELYQQIIDGWNKRSANAMAEPFVENGELIGFDGSQVIGKAEIVSHLEPIFSDHPTAPFVVKIKNVRFLVRKLLSYVQSQAWCLQGSQTLIRK